MPPSGSATAIAITPPSTYFLLDALQEAERALLEQPRRIRLVVGHAAVGEEVPVAGVEEQLCPLDRLGDLAGGGKVFLRPHGSSSMKWIWSGAPSGHEPPNSESGDAE